MADMNAPLYDIDRPGMEVAVNSYKPGNGLAWPTLFPLKFTPKFDLKGIEGDEGIPVTADRVAFNSKAPKKTRRTVGSWSGRLGKIAVSREKDELAINEYLDLKDAASRNTEDKATSFRGVEYRVCPGFLRFKYCWITSSDKGNPAGQPSTTAPIPFPWDSPQVET